MGSVSEFGKRIADLLRETPNDESAAKSFIRSRLAQSYNKPPMTEDEIQKDIDWWIAQTKEAMKANIL